MNINFYKSLITCNISDNIFMPLFSQKRICDKFSFAISSGLMILISQALMTWYTVFKQLENGCNNAKCVYWNPEIPINLNEYFTFIILKYPSCQNENNIWTGKSYSHMIFPYSTPSQRLKTWKMAFFLINTEKL